MAIFKKNGAYWIGFPLGNGKYRREKVGPSHAQAKEVLAKRQTQVAERKHFPGRVANGTPFAEVATKFWDLHGRYMQSPTWKWMFKRIKTEFGSKKVGTITTGDIQQFYNEVANNTSNSTANRYLTLVRCVFNKARVWGDFHGENPCAGVKKGREAAHRLRYLSQDEMRQLLAVAHPRLYPVLMCALLTGMRRGEILGLAWENINLEQGTLYLLKTKSGKPRELPIPGKLRDILLSLGPKPSGSVFELPIISLRAYFDKALKDAKIFGFCFHDLRHTFASHFIMKTNDLPTLQSLLGHCSPVLTQRYAHLSRGHLASEMAAFESAIPAKPMFPTVGIALELHQPLSPNPTTH